MNQLALNKLALSLYQAALQGAAASSLLARTPLQSLAARPLAQYRSIRLLAIGKSALALAGAAERELTAHPLAEALAIVPHGYAAQPLPAYEITPRARVMQAAHPLPDEAGLRAAEAALDLARETGEDDLLVVLISGGGTALLPAFAGEITLACAQATFKLLLNSGAAIDELNCVRKHISRISGGRLAAAARGDVLAVAVSDVPGDDLATIASGPTVGDPTTFAQAESILRTRGIWESLPASVRAHIEAGLRDATLESPKPGDARLARARTELIGSNRDALRGAQRAAEQAGAIAEIIPGDIEGDTHALARDFAARAASAPGDRPHVTLIGGETTLRISGKGHGGRNQELALEAAIQLQHATHPAAVLSAGSDGVDGITPPGAPSAAGALATPQTIAAAHALGLDPAAYQANNDSYGFFSALAAGGAAPEAGGHVIVGPTHCNVMDLMFVLRAPRA